MDKINLYIEKLTKEGIFLNFSMMWNKIIIIIVVEFVEIPHFRRRPIFEYIVF